MLSLANREQGWNIYSHYGKFLSLRTCVLFLIKQLSESITWVAWKEWFVLSGYTRPISMGEPCVSHLWLATQEQRDLRCQMLRSFKCSHLALWALPGSYRLQ